MPLAPASCARSRMFTALPSSTFLSPRRITIFSLALSSADLSAPGSAASETALPSTSTSPAEVTVTVTPLGVVEATAELGRSTSLPWFEITLVVTMKMIRRTRKMSVSGVMLISATMPSEISSSPPPPLGRERAAMPDLLALLFLVGRGGGLDVEQRLDEPLAGAREQARDRAHPHLQPVERGQRDDRDEQADRGGDERLRDAGRDDGEAARALRRHVVERLQDAPDRPEQADERRERADRAEHPQPAAQLGDRFAARGREHADQVFERDVQPAQALEEDPRERRLGRLAQRARGHEIVLHERVDHPAGQLPAAPVEAAQPEQLLDDHRDRDDGAEAERVDGQPALVEEVENRGGVEAGGRCGLGHAHRCLSR